jgi:methionyl-tRNA formyltransferase
MRLVFMGTPAFAVPVLQALTAAPYVQVVGVYTPPDRPRGRGRPTEFPPVKSAAEAQGLRVLQPPTLRSEQAQRELAGLEPDVIVVAAYGKLLPAQVLDTPAHGCLNLHPSLLPMYRGPSPVATAIVEGAASTGVTLMLLDRGMDTGPIISRQTYPLSGRETTETLTASLFQLGAELLLRCLAPWAAGQIEAQPQDDSMATTTHKLERADGQADWTLPALALDRRCRAYSPWPGLFTHWEGKVLKLLDVTPLPRTGAPLVLPGQVTPLGVADATVGVGTGDGILGLRTVQVEGRRAMPAGEFILGHPHFAGARL